MRRNTSVRFALNAALILLLPVAAIAQQDVQAASPQGTARNDPNGKKILGLADIGRWNRITGAALSSDGAWMTYAYSPNDGDGTLYVKQLDGTKSYAIPVGSTPSFSDDSKFVGYYVSPPSANGRGGRGGGGGRGQAQGLAPGATPSRRFELLDLASGDKYSVPDAQSFALATLIILTGLAGNVPGLWLWLRQRREIL